MQDGSVKSHLSCPARTRLNFASSADLGRRIACSSDIVSKFDPTDFVGKGIARDHKPAVTARCVVPEFAKRPARIIAQVDIVDELFRGVGCRRVGADGRGVAQDG